MGSEDEISAGFLKAMEEPTYEREQILEELAVTTAACTQFISQPLRILLRTHLQS